MTTFSEIWSTDVKPLASACVEETRIVRLIGLGENYKPNQEEKEYINSVSGMYKDCYGMYYISEMIRKVVFIKTTFSYTFKDFNENT